MKVKFNGHREHVKIVSNGNDAAIGRRNLRTTTRKPRIEVKGKLTTGRAIVLAALAALGVHGGRR